MRRTFHQRLDEITEDVIAMGSLVQEAVYNSIKAFIEMSTELAQDVIEKDEKINEYDISIEEKCIVLQAEHQPVAIDLRYLHSISIIIKCLERIGDLSVNISKVARRLAKEKKKYLDKEIIDLIVEMGNLVKPELNRALESFKNKDVKLASKLGKSDDMVDEIQKMIFRKLFTSRECSEENIKFITNIVLASRYLERIGDQSVNIGQRVLYFLSGDYTVFHDNV
ncbi:MAG TPA: phosphate signaling complex protein PhoU [Candidatus Humimicrobiaceae bacterium]